MSKVLVKNQGNYTRRLRSLDASRAKILQNYGKADTDILSLSFLMRAHAVDPYASQFVSLTPNVAIAYSFGYEKKAAIMIDERRLFSNIYSKFSSETELLTPLIIFPDEIVYFDESKTSVSVFISNYEKVTGKKFVRIPDIEIVKVFRAQAKLKQQELFGKDPAPTTECVKGVLKALLL
jgi:hypothetical protein